MRLDAQDRSALFGCSLPAHQLQKILFKRPGFKAPASEVRELFSDLSKGQYLSMLIGLQGKGVVTMSDDEIILDVDKATLKDCNLDIVWRDIRMLKSFAVADIVIDTGLSPRAIREALRVFAKQGLIKPVTEALPGKARTYNLISSEIIRPVAPRITSGGLSDKVFETVQSLEQPFFRSELTAALQERKIEVSSRYVKELLAQWIKVGILEEDGERSNPHARIRYRFVGGSNRPSVQKKGDRK